MELRICTHCHLAHAGATTCPGCRSPLTLADHTFFLGLVFGKYRIDSILGMGGMGVVYRAFHTTLGRPVALKVVLPPTPDERFEKRFRREAQVLAELKHPSIVEVYDFDINDWGAPYYVMEFLRGKSLRAVLDTPDRSRVLAHYGSLLWDIARGLAFAHRKGVVHRDLKPENIHVERYDDRVQAKILDFGIAKLLREQQQQTNLTMTGMVVGTPAYLAPEQILQRDIGPHTDQYALALIVAEILLGRQVREGKTIGEICAVEITRPLEPELLPQLVDSLLPEAITSALRRATQPHAAERFPDITAFVEALGVAATEPGPALLKCVGAPVDEIEAFSGGSPAMEGTGGTLDATPGAGRTAETIGPGSKERVPAGLAAARSTPAPQRASAERGRSMTPGTTAQSEGMPALSPSLRARRLKWRWVGAGMLLTLAATGSIFLLTRTSDRTATTTAPTPAAAAKPPFERIREIATPADATEVLGRDEDTILLKGIDCVYLVSVTAATPPARIPVGSEQGLLGVTAEGRIFLREGPRLLVRGLTAAEEPRLWAEGVPTAEFLELSPDGRWLAALMDRSVEVFSLSDGRWRRRFAAPIETRVSPRLNTGKAGLVLSARYLVYLDGDELVVHRLRDGSARLRVKVPEQRINVIAVDDGSGRVAVGGWFNQVYLYDINRVGEVATIPHHGQTLDLLFIPDHPTLAIAGESGVRLWRSGSGEIASWGGVGDVVGSVQFDGGPILALEKDRPKLHLLAYRDFPIVRSVALSKQEIWALAVDQGRRTVYAGGGGADGNLYSYRVVDGRVTTHPLHSQGITSLVLSGEHLATASDDKTIAVRQLPDMQVIWRSQAHRFLVNQLCIQGRPPSLWSTSSDGTIKRWAWPLLEEQLSLSTEELIGRHEALHAIWVDDTATMILAGSWERSLLALRRDSGGTWKAKEYQVLSPGIYSAAFIPGISAVLLVGTQFPSGVFLYDLQADTFMILDELGTYLTCALAYPGRNQVFVFGRGVIQDYQFSRDQASAISYSVRPRFNTDLGFSLAADHVQAVDLFAVGAGNGTLHLLSASGLQGEPIVRDARPERGDEARLR